MARRHGTLGQWLNPELHDHINVHVDVHVLVVATTDSRAEGPAHGLGHRAPELANLRVRAIKPVRLTDNRHRRHGTLGQWLNPELTTTSNVHVDVIGFFLTAGYLPVLSAALFCCTLRYLAFARP